MFFLTKSFDFDAAHFIPNHKGKCCRTHGHCWHVEVTYKGAQLNQLGMLVDFSDVNKLIEEVIISKLDHKHLNDILAVPTAEKIAVFIYSLLEIHKQQNNVDLHAVKVWESKDSCVEYRP
jgi:6-pyruvoyltetrahydropterin/6-carboxytetrahydropterin synthase